MRVSNRPLFQTSQTLPLTMNTTLTSDPIPLWDAWGVAFQVVWTGTPTGSFKIQVSCDAIHPGNPTGQTFTPTNWSDLTGSPLSVTAAGNNVWDVYETAFNYARLIYTDTSGGTSTAQLTVATSNVKGI